MSEGFHVKRKTLKLPCRENSFVIGNYFKGYKVERVLSVEAQKTVFLLSEDAVLCVRHHNGILPETIVNACCNNTKGLVQIIEYGTHESYWYTIDKKLSPITNWMCLSDERKTHYIRQMVSAINSLHNLGYCHLDVKPEHFGIDYEGEVRLIDLDSAQKYSALENFSESDIEYTVEYAAPELFNHSFGTYSDYFSLGKSLLEMGVSNTNDVYHRLIAKLINADYQLRPNYTQLQQILNNSIVEPNTGGRSYVLGVSVGIKKAYSDRQLALYLSMNYSQGISYIRTKPVIEFSSESEDAKLARRIYQLDPTLGLIWHGKKYKTTQEIGQDMVAGYPRKEAIFIDLISSGILIDILSPVIPSSETRDFLQNAKTNSERHYWNVAKLLGGRIPTHGNINNAISLTEVVQKKRILSELLKAALEYGDPVTTASVLHDISEEPDASNIDSAISRLRAIPIGRERNLTNISLHDAFGHYIETRLPDPENHRSVNTANELFNDETLFIIRERLFVEWKESNVRQRDLRHQRNVAVGKAVGWTALGIAFLAALPYILTGLAVIAIIVIILSIL